MVMKKGLIPLLAAGAACLPVSAGAVSAPDGEASKAVYEAGKCIVKADRNVAARLLRSLPLDGAAQLTAGQLGPAAACLTPAVPLSSSVLMRGAIAQELFFTDFRDFGVMPRNRDRLVNLNLPVEAGGDVSPQATSDLYKWADCVVRNDTENTHRLLRTRVGSPQEATVIDSLRPYMSACIPAGTRLTVAPSELRSVFAQSAYHSMYRYWNNAIGQAASRR
jgi:hypothetical protein